MICVIDASFAGAWLLPDETSPRADRFLERVLDGRHKIALPDLWTYEMINLLVTATRRRRITADQQQAALELLVEIPCQPYDHHTPLARRRTLDLAMRFDLSAYDAAYLELADRLQCPLATTDRSLARAGQTIGLPALPA